MASYGGGRYGDNNYQDPQRYEATRLYERRRSSDRGRPGVFEEKTYIQKGTGPVPQDIIYRPRDDSVEDIRRDFPPPTAGFARRPRSIGPRRDDRYSGERYRGGYGYDDAYSDDEYDHPRRDPRRRRDRGYYSDESDYNSGHEDRRDRKEDKKEEKDDKKKSTAEGILDGLGLAKLAERFGGGKSDDNAKDAAQGPDGTTEPVTRAKGEIRRRKFAQAAQAALVAGSIEAFRSRKEPGPWSGKKAIRVATAAISAGGIDGLVDRDPFVKSKRHIVEAVIGGLAANRIANGARDKGDGFYDEDGDYHSRSRSQSRLDRGISRLRSMSDRRRSESVVSSDDESSIERGRGGFNGKDALKKGALGLGLAAAGKAVYDRVRSKSRGAKEREEKQQQQQQQQRRGSSTSRSSSISSSDASYDGRRGRRGSRYRRRDSSASSIASSVEKGRGENNRGGNYIGTVGAVGAGAGAGALAAGGRPRSGSVHSNSSSDSTVTKIEEKRKHMRGKEFLTAGLATIATIHAAHNVYNSIEQHERRHQQIADGTITKAEARKKQTSAWVQDAAAVGIAALGIKGAFSEWKEMKSQR